MDCLHQLLGAHMHPLLWKLEGLSNGNRIFEVSNAAIPLYLPLTVSWFIRWRGTPIVAIQEGF